MQVLEEIFKSKKPDHTDQFNLRIHRGLSWLKKATDLDNSRFVTLKSACVRRFELPTPWSVAKCSIQLSYTHVCDFSRLMYITIYPAVCQYHFIMFRNLYFDENFHLCTQSLQHSQMHFHQFP